jgi:hypothetical protein
MVGVGMAVQLGSDGVIGATGDGRSQRGGGWGTEEEDRQAEQEEWASVRRRIGERKVVDDNLRDGWAELEED